MRFHQRAVSAAAIAAAALVFAPALRAADAPAKTAAGQPIAHPLGLPAGIQVKDLNEASDIRNAFEAVTKAAFNKDVYEDTVDRLVDADRTRIGKWTEKDFKDLQARVLILQKQWKDKYGKDFDPDKEMVFGTNGFVAIAQGEISDPAQLIGKWPVAPLTEADAKLAGAKIHPGSGAPADTAQEVRDAGKLFGGETNMNKGRNVAVAEFPAGHGMPAIRASLIHELPDKWRFDIPDNVDGKMLKNNLLKQLDLLGDGSKWPADMTEGYRMVAHHMLMAIYNIDMPNGT
ncbi:MAG TPA: hypothetical protein VFC46_01055 [Humisphaera sp.]|nr:hypothetical protein [Humisphaera sp.]